LDRQVTSRLQALGCRRSTYRAKCCCIIPDWNWSSAVEISCGRIGSTTFTDALALEIMAEVARALFGHEVAQRSVQRGSQVALAEEGSRRLYLVALAQLDGSVEVSIREKDSLAVLLHAVFHACDPVKTAGRRRIRWQPKRCGTRPYYMKAKGYMRLAAIVIIASGIAAWRLPHLLRAAIRGRSYLLEATGIMLAVCVEVLGPVFVKMAQMLSYRTDLLPAALLHPLIRLQDCASPLSPQRTRVALEAALCRPPQEVFATFADEPLASAASPWSARRRRVADSLSR